MKVSNLKTVYFNSFSSGIEKDFKKNSFIEYEKNTIVFLFFYFHDHRRVYVLSDCDTSTKKTHLFLVDVPVTVICFYEDKMCTRFRKFTRYINPQGKNFLYTLPPLFFLKLYILLGNRTFHVLEAKALFDKFSI